MKYYYKGFQISILIQHFLRKFQLTRSPQKTNFIPRRSIKELMKEYMLLFSKERKKKTKLLEIGIGDGHTLNHWAKYFCHKETKVIGIDIQIPDIAYSKKVIVYQCDQLDTVRLRQIATEHQGVDVIIDDASHFTRETKNCFDNLWEFIAPGGFYVVEDWSVGYPLGAKFYGHEANTQGMVEWVTGIIVHAKDLGIENIRLVLYGYHSMVIFQKALSKV